jgi:hypothetical protein
MKFLHCTLIIAYNSSLRNEDFSVKDETAYIFGDLWRSGDIKIVSAFAMVWVAPWVTMS